MKTISVTVYKFEDLSPEAKETARKWWRGTLDSFWSDAVIEDAVTCAACLGIEVDAHPVKLMGGGTRQDPAVYWTGFYNQGDGACFEGTYRFRRGWRKALEGYAPKDSDLFRIGEELQDAQRRLKWTGVARVKHTGRYCHYNSVSIDVESDAASGQEDACTQIVEALRDFCKWIYGQLEKEYEYQMSDECVDENLNANEYNFTADGERSMVL